MTKQQVIRIFRDYIDNDYTATGDKGYVRDALFAVADEHEIRSLGFGDYLDDEDSTDDQWYDI